MPGVTAQILTGNAPVIADRPGTPVGAQVIRLNVTVPIEVDAADWELAYGIAATDVALVADVAGHVTATITEAVTAALSAQANGTVIRTH